MPELIDNASKEKFAYPGVYDRSRPPLEAAPTAPKEEPKEEPKKKVGRPKKEPVQAVSDAPKRKTLKFSNKKE